MFELIRSLTRKSPLWGGIAVTVIVVVVLGFFLGLVLHWTPLSEAYLDSYALAVVTVGVFCGAAAAAGAAQGRGLVHGAAVAAAFFLLVLVVCLLGPGEVSFSSVLKTGLAALAAGVLGGIVGVSWR